MHSCLSHTEGHDSLSVLILTEGPDICLGVVGAVLEGLAHDHFWGHPFKIENNTFSNLLSNTVDATQFKLLNTIVNRQSHTFV